MATRPAASGESDWQKPAPTRHPRHKTHCPKADAPNCRVLMQIAEIFAAFSAGSWPLSLEESPDHFRSVRFLGRRAQQSRTAPVWLRDAMSRIDTDFIDELVDHPRQESHVVDVAPVCTVVTDDAAYVPIALLRIGIEDRQAHVRRRGDRSRTPSLFAFAHRFRPSHASPVQAVLLSPVRAARRSCSPLQPTHLDGTFGQRAGQSRNVGTRRIDEPVEQRRTRDDHCHQTEERDVQNFFSWRNRFDFAFCACFPLSDVDAANEKPHSRQCRAGQERRSDDADRIRRRQHQQ